MSLLDAYRTRLTRSVRSVARRSVAAALHHSGLMGLGFRALRAVDPKRRTVVLVYHKVVPAELSEGVDGLCSETLDDQLRVLGRHLKPATAVEAVRALSPAAGPDPRYPFLVTFDDGYDNNFRYAFPVLRDHRVPGLLFVTTEFVGTDGFIWTDEVRERLLRSPLSELRLVIDNAEVVLPLRTRTERLAAASRLKRTLKRLEHAAFVELLDQVRRRSGVTHPPHHEGTRILEWSAVRLAQAGGVTIGSHSSSHRILSTLPNDMLVEDLERSQAALERELGRRAGFFAYPNGQSGDYDDRVIDAARNAGFAFGFTMQRGIATEGDDLLRLPRFAPSDEPGAVLGLDLLRVLTTAVVRDLLRRSRGERPVPEVPQPAEEPVPRVTAVEGRR